MTETLKRAYKRCLGETALDTTIRKTYARFFGNEVLRVIYYRQMESILRRVLAADSNAVDIGCHEGNVLERILHHAPAGTHYAFEPIPDRAETLRLRFPGVRVVEAALSNAEGSADFHYLKTCDTYSGLRKRDYPKEAGTPQLLRVQTQRLDRAMPQDLPIHLIKMDVEGAEQLVLEGGEALLRRWRPTTIFQHGLGAAEFYGAGPERIFSFFERCSTKVSLMESWLLGRSALSQREFERQYYRRLNYIFVAHA